MKEYYDIAKNRVKKKKEFYNHFTMWGIICTFFFILNMITSPNIWWWVFPTLSWGLGLAIHGATTFGFFASSDWEQKQIQKEMEKLQRNDTTRVDYGELDLDDIPNREKYAQDDYKDLRKQWDDKDFV